MSVIFISYRRDDSASEAQRLQEALGREFGADSAFLDISLQAGTIWPNALQEELKCARVFLVVIGPNWLGTESTEGGQRRIDNELDWVRQELTLALSSGKRVIPVLVLGAAIPSEADLPEPIRAITG